LDPHAARSREVDRAAGTPLLLTEDAPSYGVLAALRALRAAGYAPWLAVTAAGAYGARSRARAGLVRTAPPAQQPEHYVAELAAAAQRIGAAAVLPGTDRSLLALAGHDDAFGATTLGVPDLATVRAATDKSALAELAARAGLATPPTVAVAAGDRDAIRGLSLPAIVKAPRIGAGAAVAAPARRVQTPAELERALEQPGGGDMLVQPYISGWLGAVAGVAWRGELVCAVHQRSLRIYPPEAGISAFAETVARDAELERGVGALLSELRWSGLFQAQFLHPADGEAYLIDLNPRAYGSLALAIAAGANLPAIWAQLLLGGQPSTADYRAGVGFRSEERDAGALAAAIGRRDWAAVRDTLAPRRGTAYAVFSLRDPLPFLRSVRRLAKGPGLVAGGHRL
jgi:predicted ATP-grasp superfamily ATP-dependent carboligase